MKLIQKATVAALLAVSAQAFAGIAMPTSGDSEMFLVLYNPDAQVSFTADLGAYTKTFRAEADGALNFSRSWSIDTAGAEFVKFANVAGSSTDWRWYVIGSDAVGSNIPTKPDIRSAVTTLTNGRNFDTTLNGAINGGINGPMDAYVLVVNNSGDAAMMGDVTQNGTAFGDMLTETYANKIGYSGNDGQGISGGYSADNAMNEAANFYYITRSSSSNLLAVTVDAFDNQYGMGTFQIAPTTGAYALSFTSALAPVPESGTYALMLAGLAMLGLVARRRQA
jgi:hypothetical protein